MKNFYKITTLALATLYAHTVMGSDNPLPFVLVDCSTGGKVPDDDVQPILGNGISILNIVDAYAAQNPVNENNPYTPNENTPPQ